MTFVAIGALRVNVFQKLDKRGILDLLGVRKTVGTKDLWPTPRKLLEACFCALHS